MQVIVAFCIAVALVANAVCDKVSYEGYKVFKISLENKENRNVIVELARSNRDLISIWQEDNNYMDVMVSPHIQNYFENVTYSKGMQQNEMISNVQSLIDIEKVNTFDSTEFGWTRYHELEDIEKFLDDILLKYPDVTEGFTVAQSYEGRSVRGVKISHKSGNPGIFIESNIHAREWITSATATWFINELLTSDKEEVRNLADSYDWYILPVLNVDGFVYTHTTDRLWRKTRQPVSHSPCIGVDGNRNFDSNWMVNGGASDEPCDQTYAGPSPFSEPETKGLADFLQANKEKLNILVAFHSYSQVLLSPYGHTNEEKPENFLDLMQVAKSYADAVESLSYKTAYTYGAAAEVMYFSSGGTREYAYNEVDIKISYTIEMRDLGRFGFVLPPIHILPNCEETLAGLIALTKEAKTLGYLEPKY